VVRTQPSQGWYTGSTPVRAANAFAFEKRVISRCEILRGGVSKITEWGIFCCRNCESQFRHNLPTNKNTLRSWNSAQKCREGMKRAKIKTAVPLSAGERYFEFTDSSKQLDRARKALGLKENEALLVFTDGEKEFAVATDVH
jgi:hypothetical protein